MSNDPFASTPPIYASAPRQRGCFFYGCLFTIVFAVLGMLAIGTIAYVGYRTVAKTLLEYSDDAPTAFPKVEIPPDARASLDERVKLFKEAVEAGKAAEPLVLDSNELNALISDGVEGFGDRVHFEIVDDQVEGMLALPIEKLDFMGLFGLKGKYVNAKGRFKVSLENGALIVVLDQAEVKGKPLPEEFMGNLRNDNLAAEAYKDPKNAEILGRIESITVADGKVTIRPKAPGAGDAKAAPAAPEPVSKPVEPKTEAPSGGAPVEKNPEAKTDESKGSEAKPTGKEPEVEKSAGKPESKKAEQVDLAPPKS
jgi:hypothetical protein